MLCQCKTCASRHTIDKQSIRVERQETQRQQEQEAARVSQKTGGIKSSHVNQSGNDEEGHVEAIRNGSGSQRLAKLTAENQPSGFSVRSQVLETLPYTSSTQYK